MSRLTSLLRQLVAKHVQDLVPYASARRLFSSASQSTDKSAPVWLNANEAPVAGDYQIDSGLYNRYPDCQPDALIEGMLTMQVYKHRKSLPLVAQMKGLNC